LTSDRTVRLDSPDQPLLKRLRRRSPLNSPAFWTWGAIVLAAAFVFDGVRGSGRVWADDAKPQANAKPAGEKGHEGSAGGHSDPVAPVLLDILLILFCAKVSGDLFERYGMPAVLGELAVGILLGNLGLFDIHVMDPYFKLPHFHDPAFIAKFEADPEHVAYTPSIILKILAGIGVILLLFEVGLESTVRQMMSVGWSSLLVAVLGVIAPMALGWWVSSMLIPPDDPQTDWQVHAFVGATLCATSVGITARVLRDLGRSQQAESQIILGAAVIDDVLGLVVLAVVAGVIQKGNVDFLGIAEIVGKAIAFLFGAIFLGTLIVARPLFHAASYLRGHGLLVATALVVCFGFSWLANLVGLAPIVGAFAAGLILEKTHYRELGKKEDHTLEEALAPLAAMLVPIFFVQMGTQVDLTSFADSSVWLLAASLTGVAIVGKQVCALGILEKGRNRLAVGLGMIPRGEVGLIFAGVGKELKVHGEPVIDDSTFSAVVVMVMITTMVTPPLLKWALTRGEGEPGASGEPRA
jgi:Na+:H+ antiporter